MPSYLLILLSAVHSPLDGWHTALIEMTPVIIIITINAITTLITSTTMTERSVSAS